jgi:hypothetical protein
LATLSRIAIDKITQCRRTYHIDENLRLGADYHPWDSSHVFQVSRRSRQLRARGIAMRGRIDPESIPRGTDCASVIEADVPIVVQRTRLDSQAERQRSAHNDRIRDSRLKIMATPGRDLAAAHVEFVNLGFGANTNR